MSIIAFFRTKRTKTRTGTRETKTTTFVDLDDCLPNMDDEGLHYLQARLEAEARRRYKARAGHAPAEYHARCASSVVRDMHGNAVGEAFNAAECDKLVAELNRLLLRAEAHHKP